MNIYQIIHLNEGVILSLDPGKYPELKRLWKRPGIMNHLYGLMQHMKTYSNPMPVLNNQYFLFSEKHLADWNIANGGSGSVNTWQSHKIFLLHTGLIKTHVVIGNQTDPILQRIWEAAVVSGNRSETLWSVPLYTPQVLEHAEQITREYREKHVNLTHITKKAIARAWDQRTANSLYRTSKHTNSAEDRYVEFCLRKAIKQATAEKGFTTVDEICSRGLVLCMENQNISQQEYGATIRKLLEQKRLLIDRAGFQYHRIRKIDKALAIPPAYTGFIITEK